MTRVDIKQILLLCRPGILDAEDPQIAAAIESTKHDPELGCWFRQHQIFQAAMQAKFRQIEPPKRLKLALLAHQKILNPSPSVWRRPMWLAAAAAVVLFAAGLAAVWLRPNVPDRFGNYRDIMVSKALRGYAMEWEGKDMHQLQDLIVARGAPANYELTRGLQQSQLAGGTTFRWRNNPVTMVCFCREDRQMLFLFVMKKVAVKDPPPLKPAQIKVNVLLTASWTRGDTTYVLAGPDDPNFSKYLPAL